MARHLNGPLSEAAAAESPRIFCLGKCYAAPATANDQSRPIIEAHCRQCVVLERIVAGGARTLQEYVDRGGLKGLRSALCMDPMRIISEIEASELCGRGGAGFPTGRKWRAVAEQDAPERFVVANFDEGDPGAYIDRFIVEDDPFCLIEAMAIAARAVGAPRGWIYARCEYPHAVDRLRTAIKSARSFGLLGPQVLGSDLAFDIELVVGRGSYVCGEETALLNSIEGQRPVARVRPPFVASHGLKGMPTVVNNVETLANVPWIIHRGAREYASLGVAGSRGTKLVSLNSLFRRPGLYEVEFGASLRTIVEDVGGGLRSGTLHGLLVGGPLAAVVPPDLLDTPFGFQELRSLGAGVGHGGIVAFDEHTTIPELVHHVFSFAAYESCGKCTPCRLGSSRIESLFRAASSATAVCEPGEWNDIVAALKLASLCGLGTGLAEFAESILRHYSAELRPCFK